jgi:hypothetical protein
VAAADMEVVGITAAAAVTAATGETTGSTR